MTQASLAQLPAKLFELLVNLSPQERDRVVRATFLLFGEEPPTGVQANAAPAAGAQASGGGTAGRGAAARGGPQSVEVFFREKDPANKGETLAVAARYRELHEGKEEHSKAELKKVVADARRNFDSKNFARDINNAKRQAGFFSLGTGRNARLSYYGQSYVDALPNRQAAGAIKRPKLGGGNRKKAPKDSGGKKTERRTREQ